MRSQFRIALICGAVVACGNCHTPKGPRGDIPGMELAGMAPMTKNLDLYGQRAKYQTRQGNGHRRLDRYTDRHRDPRGPAAKRQNHRAARAETSRIGMSTPSWRICARSSRSGM
jgi:hypothetical protein